MKLHEYGEWYICCPSAAYFAENRKLLFYKTLPEGWLCINKLYNGSLVYCELSAAQLRVLAMSYNKPRKNIKDAILQNEYDDVSFEFVYEFLKENRT